MKYWEARVGRKVKVTGKDLEYTTAKHGGVGKIVEKHSEQIVIVRIGHEEHAILLSDLSKCR